MNIFKGLNFLIMFCFFTSQAQTSSKLLQNVIDAYQKEREYGFKKSESVGYTIKYFKNESDFSHKLLKEIDQIDSQELSESEQISMELLSFILQDKIDNYKFKTYLNPITNEIAFHIRLAKITTVKFKNYDDVKTYLLKLDALPKNIDYNLNLLREGVKEGVSQPQAAFNNYALTYDKHIVEDATKSDFYKPFLNLPQSLLSHQRDSILKKAKISVQKNVVNQYKKIKSFFETEYFPNTRKEIGINAATNGETFYQNRINFYTTSTKYTADDIHNIGLREVDRIKTEMNQIITDLNFNGDFAAFLKFLRTDPQFYAKTPNALLMFARDVAKRMDGALPIFFKTLPRKPYGVVPVPAAIAPNYTGGRYSGTNDDTKAGFYWVNTYNLPSRPLYTIPALTAHEAVPGHHLQMSLNSELPESIPEFRRQLYLSAYGEGWALYAEFLANEMEIYTTPYEQFGKLTYEMWRACRLVVDTGIHAKGWTRQQTIDYMASNTALSIHECTTETDRYITWPGQALSYKMGELKIRDLHKRAEEKLKSNFDIREFHEVILEQGTVTLSILENRIDDYIAKNK